MTLATIFGIIVIVALAVLVRSIWGFGDGMLALPLLTLLIGFAQAAPLMALLSGVIAIQLLREQPHLVDKAGVVHAPELGHTFAADFTSVAASAKFFAANAASACLSCSPARAGISALHFAVTSLSGSAVAIRARKCRARR